MESSPKDEMSVKLEETRELYRFVATAGYSGYSPFAPGTVGSAVGLLLYVPLAFLPWWAFFLVVLLCYIPFEIAADCIESDLKSKDPSCVVIDEVLGMWVTLLFLPADAGFLWAVAGFFLFRLFDVLKPGLRPLEAMGGGRGIMLDDVGAGVMAGLVLVILHSVAC